MHNDLLYFGNERERPMSFKVIELPPLGYGNPDAKLVIKRSLKTVKSTNLRLIGLLRL